ncbi:hypothetical protein Q9233_004652 [Columba guinea]|nr:hypothetical protein Q9233_004652 [Columba guinea]
MGSLLSRRIAGVEDIDIQANSAYRYPPKSGNYFASHFFMGGEKFDTPHPEGYLFGENMDLNFLGNRPVQASSYMLSILTFSCLPILAKLV